MKSLTTMIGVAVLALLAASLPAFPADTAARQKTFVGTCAACRQLTSYAGKTDAELQTDLQGIAAGAKKHPN